jgi:hypothetical protein
VFTERHDMGLLNKTDYVTSLNSVMCLLASAFEAFVTAIFRHF